MLGVTCDKLASHCGRVEILLFTSWYRNQNKLHPDRLLGLHADLTCTLASELIQVKD